MAVTTSWISKKPDRCGGNACIRDTRITVWGLVERRQLGQTDEQILYGIQGLQQSDLDAAWEYYGANKHEVDETIRLNAVA